MVKFLKYAVTIVLVLTTGNLIAAVPPTMNYQGRLYQDNVPVNSEKSITFKLYDSNMTTELWNETQTVVVSSGIFNAILGSVNSFTIPLFDGATKYIETLINDGETPVSLGKQKVITVAYAFRAETAERATGNFEVDGNLFVGTPSTEWPFHVYGSSAVSFTAVIDHETAETNTPTPTAVLRGFTTGTAANGFGTRLMFQVENSTGALKDAAYFDGVLSTATAGSEAGAVRILTRKDSVMTEQVRVDSDGNVGIGVTNPGKALDVSGEVRSTVNGTEFYMVPKGSIIMWSGSIESLPSGWGLCDGSQDTPDLRNRFILSVSGAAEQPGLTGGATYFTLTSTSQLPAHNHTATTSTDGLHGHTVSEATTTGLGRDVFTDASITSDGGSYAWRTGSEPLIHTNGSHTHTLTVNNTGTSAPVDFMPIYYKLAFIMKL
ncbi:MAG: hypothetical protein WC955_12345 [Elusimicrobiota bacterium]